MSVCLSEERDYYVRVNDSTCLLNNFITSTFEKLEAVSRLLIAPTSAVKGECNESGN